MNSENGQINFTLGLDDTAYNQQLDEDIQKQSRLGDASEKAGKRIDDSFHQEAMSAKELSAVIETQTKVVADLRLAYEQAKETADNAFGGDETAYRNAIEQQEQLKAEYDDEREALIRLQQQQEAMGTGEDATASLRMQLRNTTQELASVTLKYREMSDAEKASAEGQALKQKMLDLAQKAGTMKDAMDDANREIRGFASDTGNFDALAGGINVVTSSIGAATGVMSMFGVSEEDLMDIQTKLQASLAISNALSVVQNNLQKESALMLGVRKIQEGAAAAAIAIRTAAEGKGVVVTTAATVAQAAFNLVAKANPYVLLATAILSVVGAFVAFSAGAKEATEEEKRQQEETKKLREEQKKMYETIGQHTGDLEAKFRSLQLQWKNLKTEADKKRWITENADKFKELGLKVNGVADAENVLVKMAPQVIQALKAVAEAEAYSDLYKEAIMNRAKKWENRTKSTATGDYYKTYHAGDAISDEEAKAAGVRTNSQRTTTYSLGGMGAHTSVENLTKSEVDKVNAYREKEAQKTNQKLKEGYDEEVDYYGKKWEEAANKATTAREKIPAQYRTGNGALNSSNSGGTSSGSGGKDTPTKSGGGSTNDPKDEAKRQLEEYYDALAEARKRREDAQAKDKETADERELAQMVLAHQRQLAEIDKEQKELAEKKKTAGKGELSEDETKMFQEQRDAENSIYERALKERADKKKKEEEEQAAKEKADMEQYLIDYGTYQERITAIHEKYETARQKANTDGSKKTLMQQEQSEIDTVNQKFGRATQSMADLFADSSKKSVKEIQKIIDKYETLIEFMEGQKGGATQTVTTDDLKGLGFTDKDIEKVNKGEISIKDLTDAIKKLKGDLGDRSPWQSFQKNIDDSIKKIKSGDLAGGISGIGEAVTEFAPMVKELGDTLGDAFGFDCETFDSVMDGLTGLGQGAQAAGQIMSGDFVGGAMSAVSAISSVVGAINKMIDAKHQKRIEELQDQIEELEESYVDLERAVNHSYSFIKQKNIQTEIESKQQQINLIQQQIEEERDKKKTDDDKISEWKDKIHDLQEEIIDLKEEAVDAVFGEDINSAIENFADAYADAWSNGTSKAESAKDTVKSMMKSMVSEAIKSAIQASGAMERIRSKLQEFFSDNVLSDWEQNYIYDMADSLQKEMDKQFGWADSLMNDSESSQDSTERGFETMTQDQADELSGRFTGIQMETSSINSKLDILSEANSKIQEQTQQVSQNIELMLEQQGLATSHLEQIARNTAPLSEMNDRLEKIEKNTRKL